MRPAAPTAISVLWLALEQAALAQGGTACRAPSWASQAVQRRGAKVTVACEAEGATQDLAELTARDKCASRLALELKSTVIVKTLLVQGDNDAATHTEVTDTTALSGLVCLSPKVATCEVDGVFKSWRQCSYDASTVAQAAVPSRDAVDTSREVVQSAPTGPTAGSIEHGSAYILTLSVTPACDDLLILGARSRRVRCSSNPIRVLLKGTETSMVIRSKGYLPKTVTLSGASAAEAAREVYLEPAD